jgi:hypothetical protein
LLVALAGETAAVSVAVELTDSVMEVSLRLTLLTEAGITVILQDRGYLAQPHR